MYTRRRTVRATSWRICSLLLAVLLFSLLAHAADPGPAPAAGNGNANQAGNNNQQQQQAGQQQAGGNNQQQQQAGGQQAGGQQAGGQQAGGQQAGGNNAAATPSPTTSAIPDSAPNGGITITQPAETADASYFKIAPGASVTFGWNFTDVLRTPKTLSVNAICTANGVTYKLAPTGIPGTATNFTWDAYAYFTNAQQSTLPPLIQATYRLVISDPEVTANGAGLMAANNKVQFAMYIPQAYTPLASGWFCSTCSGALSLKAAHPALLAIVATLCVMVAGGYSVLARAVGHPHA